jgi:integrase/recombinase XerD
LNAVRGFAGYLHGIDPVHQVPPAGLLPRENHRPSPYLLSAGDIAGLIDAAGTLRPALHAATYQTLIGVLAVAGLRPSEALTLDLTDVDLHNGVLTVHGKYGKTREILLHPSTVSELAGYAQLRDRMFPHRTDVSFFVSVLGTRLNLRRVHYVFTRLTARAGLLPRSGRCKAVPMSLRHSFAVATLVTWYQDGVDVDARMPLLSTWLGHVDPADTYWYISAPELLALAAHAVKSRARARPPTASASPRCHRSRARCGVYAHPAATVGSSAMRPVSAPCASGESAPSAGSARHA